MVTFFEEQTAASQKYVEQKIQASAESTLAEAKFYAEGRVANKADLVDGKVPANQLPAFVDDIEEYANTAAFPATGESGKLYVSLESNTVFRWSGTQYTEISKSLALGETASTAFPGDRGKAVEKAVLDEQGRAETVEQKLASDIEDLQSGKAPTQHTHTSSDVVGLEDGLVSINNAIVTKQTKLIPGNRIEIADDGVTISAKDEFQVWDGTVDQQEDVHDNMIGVAPLSDGSYPRLHARNKEIHGCKGFSNETDTHTGLELLLPWDVAMSNETSYLMAATLFESNRGMGGNTKFIQPLLPDGRIPNFEYSPLYWIGHILYNDAQDPSQSAVKQVSIPWGKIPAGGQDTFALGSELALKQNKLTAGENITIAKDGTISATGGGGSVYDVEVVESNTIILDPKVGYYSKILAADAYTFAIDASGLELTDKVAKINLVLFVGATAPVITFPSNVLFIETPTITASSTMCIELTSVNRGVFWVARVLWSTMGSYSYEVEYLESTGTQWIDTGIIPNNETGVKLEFSIKTPAGDTFRFGCRQDSGNTRFVIGTSPISLYAGFGGVIEASPTHDTFVGRRNVAQLNFLNSRVFKTNIGTIGSGLEDISDITFTYPLIMFGRNSAGSVSANAQTVYACQISQGSELVRDFIPVVDMNGVACMYDKVSNKLFYSQGTEDFIAGNKV